MEDVIWHIICSSKASGRENMDADISLYEQAEAGVLQNPTIRIYGWANNCISLGHSQDTETELHIDNCRSHGVEVVKRPTGGGIVLHNPHEITYSIVSQKSWIPFKDLMDTYIYISEAIVEGIKALGIDAEMSNTRQKGFTRYCYLFPSSHEIVYNGKKLVGSAQKRGRRAILQQGSVLVHKSDIAPAGLIKGYSGDFESRSTSISEITGRIPAHKELREALITGFNRKFRTVMI